MKRVLLIFALVLALPASADAHALLKSTTPARGAQLETAPERVVLRFTETVEPVDVRVFDGTGAEVQEGEPRGDGDTVSVRLRDGIGDGGLTATYRVVSADSHPVSGGFSFQVGSGGPGAQGVDKLLAGTESGPVTATALGVARAVQYTAIALALGALLFVALCWPGGDASRLLAVAAAAGLAASLAGIALHRVQTGTFDTRFAWSWGLAALAWIALFALRRSGWATLPAGWLLVVPAAGGHASVEGPLMLVANLVHVAAVSAWIGGLATLIFALRPATRGNPEAAAPVIRRFSRLAGYMVLLVLATGIVQSVIELSAWRELTETGYGRAILIKLGLFVVLVGFGAYHRRQPMPPLRTLRLELAVAVVVLAVTGALATYAPGKSSALGPVSTSAVLGPARMELTVDPARTGVPNELHVYLFDRRTGAQWDRTKELTIVAARGDVDLPIETRKAGPGHYVAQQALFPTRGEWTLTVTARVSDFDQYTAKVKVSIR